MHLYNSLKGINKYSGPAYPVFILFCLYAIYLIIGWIIQTFYGNGYECIFDLPLVKKWFGIEDIDIIEGLDYYINSLSDKAIDWTILESDYYINHYGLKFFGKINRRRLVRAQNR